MLRIDFPPLLCYNTLKVGEVMEKITKEMCINSKNNKWKWPFVYIIMLAVLGTIRIYVDTNSVWWLIFCIATFGTLIAIAFFVLRKRFNAVTKNNDLYISEDVFINANEINALTNQLRGFSRHNVMQFEYQIKFSRSGIHNVIFFTKAEPEDIDADYSAVFFSNPGDKFYLLMSSNAKNQNIIKAFNAKYYTLVQEDFDYIDGKYYPKQHIS